MTVPIGTILPYGGDLTDGSTVRQLADNGWLLCDGASYSKADYPHLSDVVGTAFGTSSSSRFNVPDLRGRFVRGVDNGTGKDPDAKSRAHSAPGGNQGDKVGSVQEDAMQLHKHEDEGHKHSAYSCLGNDHNKSGLEYTNAKIGDKIQIQEGKANIGGPTKVNDKDDHPRNSSETRPKNIYVNWIIKASDNKKDV